MIGKSLLKVSFGLGGLVTSALVVKSQYLKASDASKSDKEKKSIVVIGGGVMGLGTAFHLAERGHDVTLVEQAKETASWASGVNGSLLAPSAMAGWADARVRGHGMRVTKEAIFDIQFWRYGIWFVYNAVWPGRAQKNCQSLMSLTEYSYNCQKRIEEEHPQLELVGVAKNTMKLFTSEKALSKFLASDPVRFWQGKGHEFKVLSPEECKKQVPLLENKALKENFIIGGTMMEPSLDTSIDIKIFCENLEKECRRLGVKILNSTEVTKINVENNSVASVEALKQTDGKEGLICKEITLKADAFVLSAGHSSCDLGKMIGLNLPIYPMRGGLVTLKLKDGHDLSKELPYSVYSTGISVVIGPMDDGRIRISSEVQAVGKDVKYAVETAKISLNKGLVILDKHKVDVDNAKYATNMRPVSGDDLPIIGQTFIGNLYTNTGHGSKGWTLSFGSIRMIADIIEGKVPEINPEPYSPKRFHPICRRLER